MTAPGPTDGGALAERLEAFADELLDPLICRTPAYGVPGHPHCAACCYGTGLILTDEVDEAVAGAAKAMSLAAAALRRDPTEPRMPLMSSSEEQ